MGIPAPRPTVRVLWLFEAIGGIAVGVMSFVSVGVVDSVVEAVGVVGRSVEADEMAESVEVAMGVDKARLKLES